MGCICSCFSRGELREHRKFLLDTAFVSPHEISRVFICRNFGQSEATREILNEISCLNFVVNEEFKTLLEKNEERSGGLYTERDFWYRMPKVTRVSIHLGKVMFLKRKTYDAIQKNIIENLPPQVTEVYLNFGFYGQETLSFIDEGSRYDGTPVFRFPRTVNLLCLITEGRGVGNFQRCIIEHLDTNIKTLGIYCNSYQGLTELDFANFMPTIEVVEIICKQNVNPRIFFESIKSKRPTHIRITFNGELDV